MKNPLVTPGPLLHVLRAPVSRRAWSELAYSLLSLPLSLLGAAYALLSLLLSLLLAVTALGVPLLALAVPGARGFGTLRRALASRMLGERIDPPTPFTPGGHRIRAGLTDGPGWRAMAYLALSPLIWTLAFWVIVTTWAWGVLSLTYPVQHLLGVNQMTAPDGTQGLVIGSLALTTWPALLLVSLCGLLLLLLAPWAVRAIVLLDRLLIRALLGPGRAAQLRRSRAFAVDDAAATLRRLERDLHDGVQARLVALAMNLTMIGETLPSGTGEPTATLLATARANAKSAIAELRDVIRGVHPPVLDNGLPDALASLAGRTPIPVDLRVDPALNPGSGPRPDPAVETIAYFCAAELLTNAAKYGATGVRLDVRRRRGRLRLTVTDDGPGGADPSRGTGLRGLADRAAVVDGTLRLRSPAGGPTVVDVDLPIRT